jgi:hypothetical protein
LAKQDDILSALQDGNKLSGKILHSSMWSVNIRI